MNRNKIRSITIIGHSNAREHKARSTMIVPMSFMKNHERYEEEKAYYVDCPLDPEVEDRRTNLDSQDYEVELTDLRGFNERLSLENHGFKVINDPTLASYDWVSQPSPEQESSYLRKILQLLQMEFETEHVICYEIVVRHLLARDIEEIRST